jgi:hypothetical protein
MAASPRLAAQWPLMVAVTGPLAFGACAPIGPLTVNSFGPDWKSDAEFQRDHRYCQATSSRFTNNLPIYAQCMLARGNAIQYDNGSIIYPEYAVNQPPPQYQSLPSPVEPIYQPPVEETTPIPPPEPEPVSPASPLPSSPVPKSPVLQLTQEQREKLIVDILFQGGKAYLLCRKAEHPGRCAALRMAIGLAPDAKMIICNNPHILQRIPGVNEGMANAMIEIFGCPSAS